MPFLADEREQVVDGARPVDVAGLERPLEGRAAQVREQHVEVVRIDPGLLRRALEQELGWWMTYWSTGEPDAMRIPTLTSPAPAGAPQLLPRARHRAGIAGEDRDVQRADVDAELQRVGGDDAEDLAVAQAALDRPALRGQVAAAIAADPRPRPEVLRGAPRAAASG